MEILIYGWCIWVFVFFFFLIALWVLLSLIVLYLFYMFSMFWLHVHALYNVVHTILLIKCLFRCFVCMFGLHWVQKFGDNHVFMFGTTNDYVFLHFTLACFQALYAHFFIMMRAHTHSWHVVWLMPWLYHALMFRIFTGQFFF